MENSNASDSSPDSRSLALLADLMPQIVWVTDFAGKIQFINRRWYEYTGTVMESFSPELWKSVTHPDDLARVSAMQLDALRTQSTLEIEYRIRKYDGTYRWHLGRTIFVKDSFQNQPLRLGTATDIHDQKVGAEKLRIFAYISEILSSKLDLQMRLDQAASLAAEHFNGWCSLHLLESTGRFKMAAIAHRDPAKILLSRELDEKFPFVNTEKSGLASVLTTGNPIFIENVTWPEIQKNNPNLEKQRILRELNLCSYMILPLVTDRGRFGTVTIAASDRNYSLADFEVAQELARRMAWPIDNARLQEEQENSLALLDTLLNSAPVGLAFLDRNLKHVHLNPALAELNGFSVKDTLGKTIDELLPDIGMRVTPILRQVLSSGEAQRALEFSEDYHTAAGIPRSFLVSYYPVRSPKINSGEVLGVGVVVIEVTAQKEAQKKLEKAILARDEFLSIASHELKTPITGLKLQVFLRERILTHPPEWSALQEKLVKMIRIDSEQIDRLSRLVDEMLDTSRINTGKLTLNFESFDLSQLVIDVNMRFAESLEHSGCLLNCDHLEHVIGNWDRYRLEQVYINLLSNAMKYASGKPIEVTVQKRGKKAVLSVKDHGKGISQEHQERIFNRFERAVSNNEVAGLGLGLFISKEIVAAHGGSIQLESTPGLGSTFTIELPITGTPQDTN